MLTTTAWSAINSGGMIVNLVRRAELYRLVGTKLAAKCHYAAVRVRSNDHRPLKRYPTRCWHEGRSRQRSHARALNLARRQLNQEQRWELIREQLKETPAQSDRQIAVMLGVTHPTVASIRGEMEERGDVERFTTRTDSAGRQQPATKPITVYQPAASEPEQFTDSACRPVTSADLVP